MVKTYDGVKLLTISNFPAQYTLIVSCIGDYISGNGDQNNSEYFPNYHKKNKSTEITYA